MSDHGEQMMIISNRKIRAIAAILADHRDHTIARVGRHMLSANRVEITLWWDDNEPPFDADEPKGS